MLSGRWGSLSSWELQPFQWNTVTHGHGPIGLLQPEAKATDSWERPPSSALVSDEHPRVPLCRALPASAASQLWDPGLQSCAPLQPSSAPALTHFCVFTQPATFPSFRNTAVFISPWLSISFLNIKDIFFFKKYFLSFSQHFSAYEQQQMCSFPIVTKCSNKIRHYD